LGGWFSKGGKSRSVVASTAVGVGHDAGKTLAAAKGQRRRGGGGRSRAGSAKASKSAAAKSTTSAAPKPGKPRAGTKNGGLFAGSGGGGGSIVRWLVGRFRVASVAVVSTLASVVAVIRFQRDAGKGIGRRRRFGLGAPIDGSIGIPDHLDQFAPFQNLVRRSKQVRIGANVDGILQGRFIVLCIVINIAIVLGDLTVRVPFLFATIVLIGGGGGHGDDDDDEEWRMDLRKED